MQLYSSEFYFSETIYSMKQLIAKNDHFEISVDAEINRMYLKIIGFWKIQTIEGDYVASVTTALSHLKKDYTLLTDLREMKTHPAEVKELHIAAQEILVDKGLLYTAEICSSSFVEFQTDTLSKESNMPSKQFQDEKEAILFLDSCHVSNKELAN